MGHGKGLTWPVRLEYVAPMNRLHTTAERSLCRDHFQGHILTIPIKANGKRNQNPADPQMAYARVWCPNLC